jgi:cysteine desulfurase/selenocysteine lyase
MDLAAIRADFPILARTVNGKPLAYLDNAATTQKPLPVLEAVDRYYRESNANVHRGVHTLASEATALYEEAHRKAAAFLHARSWQEIVFVRNTTEALNLASTALALGHLKPGDEVLITRVDHHSNIIPWFLLKERFGIQTRMVEALPDGTLDLADFRVKLASRPKVVALTHVSNVTGWIAPLEELVPMAHEAGAHVVVDGAQAVPHFPVDVQALDADFYAFSGHKLLAPMGIGVLYGKRELLAKLPPFLGGGDMLETVCVVGGACSLCLKALPWKYEAGTANVEGAVGLSAAIDYLGALGWPALMAHEEALFRRAVEGMRRMRHVRLIGPEDLSRRVPCVPFTVEGLSASEVATALDGEGIAIRSGFHCAQPLHERLGLPASARISLAFYNTTEEVDRCLAALEALA